jgi:hypothetical protein
MAQYQQMQTVFDGCSTVFLPSRLSSDYTGCCDAEQSRIPAYNDFAAELQPRGT